MMVSVPPKLTQREREFVAQSRLFIELALNEVGASSLEELVPINERPPLPLAPVVINDYVRISELELAQLVQMYFSEFGVAYFVLQNPIIESGDGHPLLMIARQLRSGLGLDYPLNHPMEGHPEAVARFGQPDGTLKIYDLDKDPQKGYREQAETSEMFAPHNDGLGYGGAVQTAALYSDSAPLWGGFTFFLNIVRLSLDLARRDYEAFESLFMPDALTALRPRGKGAIEVRSPVLFVNERMVPQAFFRVTTGEYKMTWRSNLPALERAREFLHFHARPFAPSSSFVHFSAPGHGCFIRNQPVVHGRTPFLDGTDTSKRRVLSRKWFMSGPEHAVYKHVPGMYILPRYADLFPEFFAPDKLEGEWLYDDSTRENRRSR